MLKWDLKWDVNCETRHIITILQPRPRVRKALPPPRDGKGKGSKVKGGKGKGGKGKTKSHVFDTRNQCAYGFNNNQKVTRCMKYNAGECKRDNCHYFHACSIRLPSGRPCMQNHAAKDHRGSTWLGDIDPDLQSSEPHLQNSYSTIHYPEAPNLYLTDSDQSTSSLPTPVLPTSNNTSTTITEASFDSPSLFTTSVSTPSTLPNTSDSNRQSNINTPSATTQASQPIRLFLDFFAGHGAPLLRSHRSQHWSFYPFDIEFDHTCDILNNDHIENPLKLAHSGLIGPFGLPPHVASTLPSGRMMVDHPLLDLRESKEIHLHRSFPTRRFCRTKTTSQFFGLEGTISPTVPIPMCLSLGSYTSLQVGSWHLQNMGYCSNIRENFDIGTTMSSS